MLTAEEQRLVSRWRDEEIDRLRAQFDAELASEGRTVGLDGVTLRHAGPGLSLVHAVYRSLRALLWPMSAEQVCATSAYVHARLTAYRLGAVPSPLPPYTKIGGG